MNRQPCFFFGHSADGNDFAGTEGVLDDGENVTTSVFKIKLRSTHTVNEIIIVLSLPQQRRVVSVHFFITVKWRQHQKI